MENEQIKKRLDWLDEQRKKEAEEAQRLRTSIKELNNTVSAMKKQIEDLSGEVSRIAASAARIAQIDETLSKHRGEVSRQLEEAEARRTMKEKQQEALRSSDQKALADSIDGVRSELERVEILSEQVEQRRSEDVRLNRELGEAVEELRGLASKVDDQSVRLVGLEETIAQETRRLGETQSELSALRRTSEDIRNALDSVEDRTRKAEVTLSELKSSDRERSDQLETWMEEQRMHLVDFEKRWTGWQKRFDTFEAQAKEVEEKIITYDRTHREITQMQEQLESLLERLERRITEVGEMQRLSEERMKQDWATFEANETQKWSTFKLSIDERWKEHQRLHEKLGQTVEKLENVRTEIRADLDAMSKREANKVGELVAFTRQWLKDLEK